MTEVPSAFDHFSQKIGSRQAAGKDMFEWDAAGKAEGLH